ncbi:hypothetical protein CU098_000557, partial [Rhizopus stolonifer]
PYSANTYYKQYHGRLFSSMESEKCQIMYIESSEPASTSNLDEETLPICSVCLEPMDDQLTGLLTILCQHTFHSHCLSKWGDSSCPICRYSHHPKPTEPSSSQKNTLISQLLELHDQSDNQCSVCQSTSHLWVCLICGHIGCGRYHGAHAYEHYQQTDHLYALEIDTQRVWDYAGDNYVHRLIQNAVDGKLVELPTQEQAAQSEKLEVMSIEYSYLLTSQLDSQRIYYENQMDQISSQLSELTCQTRTLLAESDKTQAENKRLEEENNQKERKVLEIKQEKKLSEEKLETWKEKFESTKKIWLAEKESTNSLLENNNLLMKDMEEKEKAIKDLNDQVRDLMFFLEAREKVQGNPELEGASVGTRQKRNKKRGKRS